MRVALLSTLDRLTAPGHLRAPFRQFAGSRIVERQIDLALAAGCETIACLVDGIGREVIEAQRRAERGGARFVALQDPRPLSGLITTADELLVLSSGVLPDEDAVLRHVARPTVLVFPAEIAVSRGYERIDAEFAWSGAMLILGANVERLAELAPDADIISALLRIALQSGVRIHPLEKRLIEEGAWHLSPNENELAEREARWIGAHATPAPFTAPGLAIAERIGVRLARDIIGGKGARIPAIAAGFSGILALSSGILGYPLASFGFGALMAMLGVAGETVERIAQAGQIGRSRSTLTKAIDWLLDPILAILIALASPEDTEWLRLFVPTVLFGLLRLAQFRGSGKWRESYRDRVALALLMVPAAFLGIVQPVVAVMVLIVLLSLFRLSDRAE